MPSHEEYEPVHDDTFGIHVWTSQLQRCPIWVMDASGSKVVHSHHMRCAWCGLARHGAYAEQGAYHYFTYDHPAPRIQTVADAERTGFGHELLPPCGRTRKLPSGIVVLRVEVCARCTHYVHFYEQSGECSCGCNAGTIVLVGCFRRK